MPILSDDYRDWFLVTTAIRDLSRSKIVNLGRRFESQFLLVRVSSKAQKETWNFGGRIWATSLVLAKQAKFYQVDLDLFEQELIVASRSAIIATTTSSVIISVATIAVIFVVGVGYFSLVLPNFQDDIWEVIRCLVE